MSKKIYIIFIMLLCLLFLFLNNKVMARDDSYEQYDIFSEEDYDYDYDSIVGIYKEGGSFESESINMLVFWLINLKEEASNNRDSEHDEIVQKVEECAKKITNNSTEIRMGPIKIKNIYEIVFKEECTELSNGIIKNWIDGLLYARVNRKEYTDNGGISYSAEWNEKYQPILEDLEKEKNRRKTDNLWDVEDGWSIYIFGKIKEYDGDGIIQWYGDRALWSTEIPGLYYEAIIEVYEKYIVGEGKKYEDFISESNGDALSAISFMWLAEFNARDDGNGTVHSRHEEIKNVLKTALKNKMNQIYAEGTFDRINIAEYYKILFRRDAGQIRDDILNEWIEVLEEEEEEFCRENIPPTEEGLEAAPQSERIANWNKSFKPILQELISEKNRRLGSNGSGGSNGGGGSSTGAAGIDTYSITQSGTGTSGIDSIIQGADAFLDRGTKTTLNTDSIKSVSDSIFNIFVAVGTVIVVIVGAILGIQYIMGSVEEKAKVQESLIPFIIGSVVIFGAFGIWKVTVLLLSGLS